MLENGDMSTFELGEDNIQTLKREGEIMAQMMNWDKPSNMAQTIASGIIPQGIERMKEMNKNIALKGPEDYEDEGTTAPAYDSQTKEIIQPDNNGP